MTRHAKHAVNPRRKGTEIVPARGAPTAPFPPWMERSGDLLADFWEHRDGAIDLRAPKAGGAEPKAGSST